jgi:hypothetical protein
MKNLKGILVVLVVIAVGFLTVKLLPPFVYNYNLHADTDNMVLQYTYAQGATAEGIRADVIAKAKEHDITLADEDVDVDRTQSGVTINVHYTVPVKIPGREIPLKFEFTSGNKMITAK